MSSRVAVVAIAAALSLLGCASVTPTVSPSATASIVMVPSASAVAPPSATASTSSNAALAIEDPAYLAGDVFSLPVGDDGADWTAPSQAPVMPNGQPAVRVAFLPADCVQAAYTILVGDGPPEDTWETSLRESDDTHPYTYATWPAAQAPECVDGHGRTYLEVGYNPFVPLGTIHLVASIANVDDPSSGVDVLPVFTSADATQPAIAMPGSFGLVPIKGPEKPRSATPTKTVETTFVRATLPDGSTPTRWGLVVTGCGPAGPEPMVITARVGDTAPVDVGTCSDGSFTSDDMSLPVPADGTPVVVLVAGGTTKSQMRISEFQWRGDRG